MSLTYGPRGRTVLIERPTERGSIVATHDGATVLRHVADLPDPAGRCLAEVIKEACVRTESLAGDGTTTTAILALEALLAGYRVTAGSFEDVPEVVAQMNKDLQIILAGIDAFSREATEEDLVRLAVSCAKGNVALSEAIVGAVLDCGEGGTVRVTKGVQVGYAGFMQPGLVIKAVPASFVFKDTGTIDHALVAVVKTPILSADTVVPILEEASQWPDHPLVIVAPAIGGQALKTILVNNAERRSGKSQAGLVGQPVTALHTRSMFRDWNGDLEDLAASIDGAVWDPDVGDFDAATHLGKSLAVTVGNTDTEFVAFPDRDEEKVTARVRALEGLLGSSHTYDEDRIRDRIAGLRNGLVVLKVLEDTELASKATMAAAEDALLAVTGALRHGVVPSSASLLYWLSEHLDPHSVLREALRKPVWYLGMESPWIAYGETIWDAVTASPVDPWMHIDATASVRESLVGAVSAATSLLSTEILVLR